MHTMMKRKLLLKTKMYFRYLVFNYLLVALIPDLLPDK